MACVGGPGLENKRKRKSKERDGRVMLVSATSKKGGERESQHMAMSADRIQKKEKIGGGEEKDRHMVMSDNRIE